jgi:hypothetical protein
MLVVLTILAVWRIARLVAVDEVTRPLRERIAARGDTWAYFITCPWCVSVWLAPPFAVAAIWWPTNRVVWVVVLSLAASLAAGIGQGVEDRLDR